MKKRDKLKTVAGYALLAAICGCGGLEKQTASAAEGKAEQPEVPTYVAALAKRNGREILATFSERAYYMHFPEIAPREGLPTDGEVKGALRKLLLDNDLVSEKSELHEEGTLDSI